MHRGQGLRNARGHEESMWIAAGTKLWGTYLLCFVATVGLEGKQGNSLGCITAWYGGTFESRGMRPV